MQEKIQKIEEELTLIKNRNISVEADKAWEISFTRIFFVALVTYIVVVTFFIINDVEKPFLNGLVPVFGFILSTQALPFVKKYWFKNYKK